METGVLSQLYFTFSLSVDKMLVVCVTVYDCNVWQMTNAVSLYLQTSEKIGTTSVLYTFVFIGANRSKTTLKVNSRPKLI